MTRVLPQERATPASSLEKTSKQVSREKFKERMRVAEIDEAPKQKNLFTLIEEEEKENAQNALSTAALQYQRATFLSETAQAQEIQATTTVELEVLFEKMAAEMIILTTSLETETTLYLDNPDSLFCGTRITIREFTTAPKTFNIEIASHTAAVHCVELHREALLKAFSEKNFNFSIHRLETEIENAEERPLFHRKEREDDAQDGRF